MFLLFSHRHRLTFRVFLKFTKRDHPRLNHATSVKHFIKVYVMHRKNINGLLF